MPLKIFVINNTLTRCVFYIACFVFYTIPLNAQQPYFQQEVNYKISVRLNDVKHTLSGLEEIQYINNSDKALYYLYFHLWPNAYKNNSTALAKQLAENGETNLVFSEEKDRGYIDSLNFSVNGKAVTIEPTEHIDVIKLILNEPLKSLDTLQIRTPFFVKIPNSKFSRLGHTQQAYFITQWYPKPAVYDSEGWHAMPYLDQGEFFSEFGSFDVSITLPKNYLLAATGDRIDAEQEEDWLNTKVIETITKLEKNAFKTNLFSPISDTIFKTVRFQQFKVHDFAWFADKTWNVLHDQIELPLSKRIVDTWIFFSNQNAAYWKEALTYINESTLFYSYLNGEYPYNHVTAVDGTTMAGGGMEYPNITVIGDVSSATELDITIAHEVGHNWFYGILGSNERDNPAMDEGLNSFYEMRYMQAKYPKKTLSEYLGLPFKDTVKNRFGLARIPYWKEKEITYLLSARANTDQPIHTKAGDLTNFNYGSIIYSKSAVAFQYLMYYMGTENFDKAMQFYFNNYKFKHPTTGDLFKTLQYHSDADLTWFKTHFILKNDKFDYKLSHHKRLKDGSHWVYVKNKTGSLVPFTLQGYKNNKLVGQVWSDGITHKGKLEFPVSEIDYFKIDGDEMLPETYRHNNTIRTKGLFRKWEPIKFNFIAAVENPKYAYLNYLPLVAYNYYNKWQAGVAFHNYGIYSKRFDYALAPFYAFKTRTLTGMGNVAFNLYPKKYFERISLETNVKSFAYDRFNTRYLNAANEVNYSSVDLSYLRYSPSLVLVFKPSPARSSINQELRYTNHNIRQQQIDISQLTNYKATGPVRETRSFFVNELAYVIANKRKMDPYRMELQLQHTHQMAKVSINAEYYISITKTKQFKIAAFAGTFLAGTTAQRQPYAFRLSGYNGFHDYLFTDIFLARNEFSGLGFSQFAERDGAFKVWTPLGQTTEWLATAHVTTPTLLKLPLKLFADVGAADARSLNRQTVLYAAGLNVTLVKKIIEVYIPLLYSSDIRETLKLNNKTFWETLRFTLNLHRIEFKKTIKNNLF